MLLLGIAVRTIGAVVVTAAVAAFAAITSSRVVVPGSIDARRIRIAEPPFRQGVGQRDEIGWGEDEDVVTTTAAMSSRKGEVRNAARGEGGGRMM